MKSSDTMRAMWFVKLRELRAHGYDPRNSVCAMRVGRISLCWR